MGRAGVRYSEQRQIWSDSLEVYLDRVKMPADNGKIAEKTKGLPLVMLSAIKKIIVVVNAVICVCLSK